MAGEKTAGVAVEHRAQNETRANKVDLIVPIYVDTNALLDLLASIEGGFSIVEKVTTRTTAAVGSEKAISGEMGTEFGIPNVLNLLKIKLSSSLSTQKRQETGEEREIERYHTYGSLLYRLRAYLGKEHLLKRPSVDGEELEKITPSDFVEVHGIFRPHPIIDFLEFLDGTIEFFEISSGFKSNVSSQPPGKQKKLAQDDKAQTQQIRQFLQRALGDIEKKGTRVFVIDTTGPSQFQTVVLLFVDYLRDRTMAEISYKEYRLLGKVVRKIGRDSEEKIDLLRGTALGGMGRGLLEQLSTLISQVGNISFPREIKLEVSGPALEVVPIAVYI